MSRRRLPVGEVWRPTTKATKHGRPKEFLQDPARGIFSGPIFIRRELPWEEYRSLKEDELGETIRPSDYQRYFRNFRFYEISID